MIYLMELPGARTFSLECFLAYFQILKKYAIVRTKSVRPSVADSTPRGLTDLVPFRLNRYLMVPGSELRKEFFVGPVLDLGEAF